MSIEYLNPPSEAVAEAATSVRAEVFYNESENLIVVNNPELQQGDQVPVITMTPARTVNARTDATTESEVAGQVEPNQKLLISGYVNGADGYKWYYYQDTNENGQKINKLIRGDLLFPVGGQDPEQLWDLTDVASIPVLGKDGTPTNQRLIDLQSLNLAGAKSTFQNLVTGYNFPEGTFSSQNLGLLENGENELVFMQTNPLERLEGGVNEAGSVFTFYISNGDIAPSYFIGFGDVLRAAQEKNIQIPQGSIFMKGDLPEGKFKLGNNIIFELDEAQMDLADGLPQNEAFTDAMLVVEGSLPDDINFVLDGDRVVLSTGKVIPLEIVDGVRKVTFKESDFYIMADYERELAKLPSQYLPLVDSGEIKFSQKYVGFVDSQGRIYRAEASQNDKDHKNESEIEHAWMKEATRETFDLIDMNGDSFSIVVTLESMASKGFGKSELPEADFRKEMEDNLKILAQKYMLASFFNGKVIHIINPRDVQPSRGPGKMENYLESVQTNPHYAFGINETEGKDIFLRVYTSAPFTNNPRPGSTIEDMDESYFTGLLAEGFNILINVQSLPPDADINVRHLDSVDEQFKDVYKIMAPLLPGSTGSFHDSTRLVDFHEPSMTVASS